MEHTHSSTSVFFLLETKINELHFWHGLENSTVVLAGRTSAPELSSNLTEKATSTQGKAGQSDPLAYQVGPENRAKMLAERGVSFRGSSISAI